MTTRKEKRACEKNTNYFFEFTKIQKYFFKDIQIKLMSVKDPRHHSYVTYGSGMLFWMMILKDVCILKSMRSLTNQLNKDECIENPKK